MKILVTGGAGYIGSVLVTSLVAEGHEVRCLDLRADDMPTMLDLSGDGWNRCELLAGDVRLPRDVVAAVHNVDLVVHLAAVVGSPACDADPTAARSTNIDGTRTLIRSMPTGLPLICLSTCSVYGRALKAICRETDTVHPLTLYGESKWTSEQIVTEHGGVVLRATTVYGPSPRFRWDLLIHTFVRLALTTGRLKLFEPHAIRPFIHVDDVARAVMFAIRHVDAMAGGTYNIGSTDSTLSKLELASRIGRLTNLQVEIDHSGRDPDGRHYKVAFDEIQRLGYSVHLTLDQGLQHTLKSIRALMPGGA